ncbi:DUF3108 domain-containing protein [Burkholderia alba]|uniref:DUF3108 domain-containing protein n=1 Tax=Burkholderia alba TaxID=2683677 RepID=UPI002B057E7D|nr:DUF3108 domain-containing protein [Burkholderia alba]
MPLSSTLSNRPAAATRRLLRVGVVLALVLGMHWLAAQWVSRYREPFTPLAPANAPVEIELLKPQQIERQPAAAPPPKPQPAARAPRRPAPQPSQPSAPVLSALASPVTTSAAEPASASGTAPASAAAGQGGTQATPAGHASDAASAGVKFSVPPSGDLQYDTFYNGVQNATGTIHWRSDGRTYSLSVTMPVPFVGPFRYQSHGRIDAFGIAPDQYVEQRGKRPSDVAIFNRDTKQIVFTRTPDSLALPDGAQDRFSMLMQLAGLLRGNPDAYRPGVTREFFVVDNNSGEIWPITTIGDETVRTAEGMLETRHFMRLPRRPGDTRRIDLWLAPSLGWLPARMVQTEPGGAQIELLWHGRAQTDEENDNESAPLPGASDSSGPVNSTEPAVPGATHDDAPVSP